MRAPESEYHGYVKRRKSNAQIEREALEGLAAERLGLHKGRYGYRRINRELRRDGIVVSEKRVLAAMRKLGLQVKRNAFKRIVLHYNKAEETLSDRLNAPCDLEQDVA